MSRGACNGCLRIFVVENQSKMRVSVCHQHTHLPYEDIQLPEHWKEFIKNNLNMTPGKVCLLIYIYILILIKVLDLAVYDGN
jgi:hypothetical protein